MTKEKTLIAFFAHPDDEILGSGGTIAHCAAAGVNTKLVCATRGEAGEISDPELAVPATLAAVREAELRCSAKALGIREVTFLGYRDSGMAGTVENKHPQAFINIPAEVVVPQLVTIIRRERPQVILTFEPYGGYGHPDHIAIHQHTMSAYEAAAEPDYFPELGEPWHTPCLFYPVIPTFFLMNLKRRMEEYGMDVSFFEQIEERRHERWPDDQIHLIMDISSYTTNKWNAFLCHATQFGTDSIFRRLPEFEMQSLFRREYFALARPQPEEGQRLNGLFEGLDMQAATTE